MRPVFLTLLFVLGACFGSFLCCQVRRLHFRENHPDEKHLGARSLCLVCRHKLSWYENIPILSWLFLRGRCRTCGTKIGLVEFLSEIGLALAFLLFGLNFDCTTTDPFAWAIFLLNLLLMCILGFLAIYDAAYIELPSFALILAIIVAALILLLRQTNTYLETGLTTELIMEPLASVAILSGIYLILCLISKGKWVGDGDWLLGLSLGLALGNPWLALLTLCFANLFACLGALPAYHHLKTDDERSRLHIPLGPYFVIAYVIVACSQNFLFTILM